MNYCVAEDVQVLVGHKDAFSTATRPTLTQLNTIIGDITNEIDLQLSIIGIGTQPTDSKILSKLKSGCIFGAAGRAGFGALSPANSTNDTKPKTFYQLYQDFLNEIITKPEIYSVVSGAEIVNCGTNETLGTNNQSDNEEIMMQADWKS